MTKEEFIELHKQLVQTIADFIKDKEIPNGSWILSFSVDDLEELKKYGMWVPANDSYLGILDRNNDELMYSM